MKTDMDIIAEQCEAIDRMEGREPLPPVRPEPLLAGDLILAGDVLWEVIDDEEQEGDRPAPGVTLENGHWMRAGRILSYGVRGYDRRDYSQVMPDDIQTAWRMDRIANDCSEARL